MKKILLAKKGKRILSRLIDFSIVFLLTIISFLTLVYPNTFNEEKFKQNSEEIIELYKGSGLFIVDKDGNYTAKCSFSTIVELDHLYSTEVTYGEEKYQIALSESLYKYYTTTFNKYGGLNNLNYDSYCSNVLKLGTEESNIKSFNVDTYKFELIDETKKDITVNYFISKYQAACQALMTDSKIQTLTTENQTLMLNSIKLIIPLLLGFSFIFDFLVPIFSKESQTIGKHIFGLAVLDKNGYHYKKSKHILRFIGYIGIEIMLGFITVGGMIMISYTMFLFMKNRRCLHDVIGSSIVIDEKESFFFKDEKEEAYYINRAKRKGFYHG